MTSHSYQHLLFLKLLGLARGIGAKMLSRNSYNLFPIILQEVVHLKKAPLEVMYQAALAEEAEDRREQ